MLTSNSHRILNKKLTLKSTNISPGHDLFKNQFLKKKNLFAPIEPPRSHNFSRSLPTQFLRENQTTLASKFSSTRSDWQSLLHRIILGCSRINYILLHTERLLHTWQLNNTNSNHSFIKQLPQINSSATSGPPGDSSFWIPG